MTIKVEFHAVDHRFIARYAVAKLNGRAIERFSILRCRGFALQQSIDRATDHAANAASRASNENGIEFTRFDIDYSGLRAIENRAARCRTRILSHAS